MDDVPETFRVLLRGPRESWWWDHVRSVLDDPTERNEIPETVHPLLLGSGVRTTALSREEAVAIRDWAETLPGWEEEPGLQLLRHPSQAVVDWHEL